MAKTKSKKQKILETYLKKQEAIELKIDESSKLIREKIDLNDLLKDPVKYITELGKQYYLSHNKEVLEAIKIGEEGTKKIIRETYGKENNTNEKRNI